MEASEVPPYFEYVDDEVDGVDGGDGEHGREVRQPRIAAYHAQLALAYQEHRRIVKVPVM